MVHWRRYLFNGLPINKLEATVEEGAASQFKMNFTHYWFTSSGEVLSEETLTFLKPRELREPKMFLMHDAMSDLFAPLHTSGGTTFQARHRTGQTWSGFPVLISYFCDLLEAEETSIVIHGSTEHVPRVRSINAMDTARNLQYDRPQTWPEMKWTRHFVRWIERGL